MNTPRIAARATRADAGLAAHRPRGAAACLAARRFACDPARNRARGDALSGASRAPVYCLNLKEPA